MAWNLGYTPVGRAQSEIAQTIKGGLAGLGQQELNKARMGLEERALMHSIAREKSADKRADLKLGIEQDRLGIQQEQLGMQQEMQEHTIGMQNDQEERSAKAAMNAQWLFNQQKPSVIAARKQAELAGKDFDQMVDLRNQHLNGKGMALFYLGPNASRETLSDFTVNGKIDQIMKATGATVEIIDGETKYRKKNGELATWWDMPKISPIANDVFLSGADPILKTKQNIREYEKLLDQGGGTPEQHEQYLKMKQVVDNPQWQIESYRRLQDIDFAKREAYKKRGMDTSVFETNIARRANKMEKLQGAISAKAVQAGKEEIEKIKTAGKLIGTLEKDARFMSLISGKNKDGKPNLSVEEATNIRRADKTLAEALRGAHEEIKTRIPYPEDLEPKALAALINEIKKSWGVDANSLKNRREAKPKTTKNPDNLDLTPKELLFK